MEKHYLLLGAHISIAGGVYRVFERGEALGCSALQIFTKSNRRWQAGPFKSEEIEKFNEAQKHSSVKIVIAHAGYLLNIASPNKEVYEKSTVALHDELRRAEQLGIPTLVVHPGSRQDLPLDKALHQIAHACDEVLSKTPGKVKLALETMAGQGSSVGGLLEHLATIIDKVQNKDRLGICVDTCHIHAAGYDIRTEKAYQKFWHTFDTVIGLKKLCALHLNDSKNELGTKRDRHEFIAQGKIGKEAFKLLINDERFFDIPKILETPVADQMEYADDLKVLKNLITPETKKKLVE